MKGVMFHFDGINKCTMSGRKISCPKCRRSYDSKIEYCPFCGSQNPLFEATNRETSNASLANIYSEDASAAYETYDDQEYYDESAETKAQYQENIYEDYSESTEDIAFSSNIEPKANTSELSTSANRDKIHWTDEEHEDTSDHAPMYDSNGEYNPNYDHYYDDRKAKIDSALESLSNGKEKAILKILFGIAAIIGIIVYLILTLY